MRSSPLIQKFYTKHVVDQLTEKNIQSLPPPFKNFVYKSFRDASTSGSTSFPSRHLNAVVNPTFPGEILIVVLAAVIQYCEDHTSQYGALIGDDYVLGPGVTDILQGVRTLLNGSLGRLDGGLLDGLLLGIAEHYGIEVD